MAEMTRLFMIDVVGEVPSVPDHNVLTVDRFAIDPTVEPGFKGRPDRHGAVVDFAAAVTQNPHIAARERPIWHLGRDPVFGAGNDVVGLARRLVGDPPFAL